MRDRPVDDREGPGLLLLRRASGSGVAASVVGARLSGGAVDSTEWRIAG